MLLRSARVGNVQVVIVAVANACLLQLAFPILFDHGPNFVSRRVVGTAFRHAAGRKEFEGGFAEFGFLEGLVETNGFFAG